MRSTKFKGQKNSNRHFSIQKSQTDLLIFQMQGTTCLFSLTRDHLKYFPSTHNLSGSKAQSSIQRVVAQHLSVPKWITSTHHKRLLYCSMPLLLFDCSSTVWTHPQWKMQHIVCFWRCGKCCFARIFYPALWKRSIFSFTSTKKTMLASCIWCPLAQAKGKWCLQKKVLRAYWLFREHNRKSYSEI